jgi:cytochrome c
MKYFLTAAAALALAAPAFAEGDAAAGEKEFNKCKACHMIETADGESIVKGGKVGPNLWGVIGRVAGSNEDFKYGDGLIAANEAGFEWTQEALAEYVVDPKAWLDSQGFPAKSKMTFKLRKGGEDVAAYLATFSEEAGGS